MHELSIAMSIIDVVLEEAGRLGDVAVAAVHVRLGPLSGIVKEPLLSAYQLAREGTPLANTRLLIEEMPLVLYCPICEADVPATSVQVLTCSRCGTSDARIAGGDELDITALEIEA